MGLLGPAYTKAKVGYVCVCVCVCACASASSQYLHQKSIYDHSHTHTHPHPKNTQAYLWKKFTPYNTHTHTRYYLAAVISTFSACLFFLPGPFFRRSLVDTVAALLSPHTITNTHTHTQTPTPTMADDNGATEVALLCVCVCVRFVTSVLDTNIHVPSGDWLCLFAVGAGMGRLLGHGFRQVCVCVCVC
jgi:hypothetical protein